jgi:hypothetical protein
VFQMKMKDGSEMLARLSYPSTKPSRLTSVSEVAVMESEEADQTTAQIAMSSSAEKLKKMSAKVDGANSTNNTFARYGQQRIGDKLPQEQHWIAVTTVRVRMKSLIRH